MHLLFLFSSRLVDFSFLSPSPKNRCLMHIEEQVRTSTSEAIDERVSCVCFSPFDSQAKSFVKLKSPTNVTMKNASVTSKRRTSFARLVRLFSASSSLCSSSPLIYSYLFNNNKKKKKTKRPMNSCRNNCGFHSHPNFDGFCSRCYRVEEDLSTPSQTQRTTTTPTTTTAATARAMCPNCKKPMEFCNIHVRVAKHSV